LFAPGFIENFPGSHSRHVSIPTLLELEEYFPARQLIHEVFPTKNLYFPGIHSWHGSPSGPVVPAIHMHCVFLPLPTDDIEFNSQFKHVL